MNFILHRLNYGIFDLIMELLGKILIFFSFRVRVRVSIRVRTTLGVELGLGLRVEFEIGLGYDYILQNSIIMICLAH